MEGIPQPTVTWLRDGKPLIGKATVSVVDHERAHHRLVLENIKVIRSEADHLIMPQMQSRAPIFFALPGECHLPNQSQKRVWRGRQQCRSGSKSYRCYHGTNLFDGECV